MKRRPYLALILLMLLVIGNGLLLRHYMKTPKEVAPETLIVSTPPFDQNQERELSVAEQSLLEQLNLALHAPNHLWPKTFNPTPKDISGQQLAISYTIDEALQTEVQKLLKQYRSDYSAVVIVDNNTGAIKVALDHSWSENRFGKKLAFFSTSPAASLFKVITAADVLERGLSSSEYFTYRGKPSTLFKNQLGNLEPEHLNKKNTAPWEKALTFKTAFAKSNNVVFGKAALQYTKASHIYQTAERFGFNRLMIPYLDLSKSYFPMASDAYNLAELASGLNTTTLISPLHAAFIAMTIVNNGELKSLKLIDGIYRLNDPSDNLVEDFPVLKLAQQHRHWPVIKEQTAATLREMMQETLLSGTAMKIRKQLPKSVWERWEIGAKTGQMTGGIPLGKRDWLMLYAKPKDGNGIDGDRSDLGISMAIMLVNQEKWYVRSTAIAKEIIQYYDGTKRLTP